MIIKFFAEGAWHMFDDVDSLSYVRLRPDDSIGEGDAEPASDDEIAHTFGGVGDTIDDIIDFTGTLAQGSDVSVATLTNRVLLSFMNSKQLESSQICTYAPVYLMNNNGRTIETI